MQPVHAENPNAPDQMQLLDLLRQRTRPQHEQIEQVVPVLRDGLTRAEYAWYLRKLLGFLRPLEPLLQRHLGELAAFEMPARCKVPWLEQDLRALGEDPAVPECPWPPAIDGAARALGCLYVLEGSTLGGQVLARRVAALGLQPGAGASYLTAYGERTGPMWRRFREALATHEAARGSREQIVSGAQDTFCALDAWLRDGRAALSPGAAPRG